MEGTIIFGITSGLLSLVGLIAIYVTINSQQNIQKAKEYIWEMKSFILLDNKGDDKSAKQLEWIFEHYSDLQKADFPVKLVVSLAVVVVVFCGAGWLFYTSQNKALLDQVMIYFVWSSCLLLLFFVTILVLLTQTSFIGNLPQPKKIMSLYSTEQGIHMGDLMFSHAKLLIDIDYEQEIHECHVKFPYSPALKEAQFLLNISYISKLDEAKDFIKTIKPKTIGNSLVTFEFNNPLKICTNEADGEIKVMLILEEKNLNENYVSAARLRARYTVNQSKLLEKKSVESKIEMYPDEILGSLTTLWDRR